MRLEDIVSKARETLFDVSASLNLADPSNNLKSNTYRARLYENIEKMDHKRSAGLWSRLKDSMFENTQQEVKAGRELLDDTYLLNNCLKCKCSGCAVIGPECRCASCVYGTYTIACDGTRKISKADPDVLQIDGYSDIRTEVDIKMGDIKYFGTDYAGIEKRIK